MGILLTSLVYYYSEIIINKEDLIMKKSLIRIFRHYRVFLKILVNKVSAGFKRSTEYECE